MPKNYKPPPLHGKQVGVNIQVRRNAIQVPLTGSRARIAGSLNSLVLTQTAYSWNLSLCILSIMTD